MSKGIITIATNKNIYYIQALCLCASIREVCPDIKVSVLLNKKIGKDLIEYGRRYFHKQIIIDDKLYPGTLTGAKVLVYEFSPYTETLFIDSDCIVFKNLRGIFDRLSGRPFYTVGKKIGKGGKWWNVDIYKFARRHFAQRGGFFLLNGGFLYFSRNKAAEQFFKYFKDICVGLCEILGDVIIDELGMSIAINKMGWSIDWDLSYCLSVIDSDNFDISFKSKRVKFKKSGLEASPAILHLAGVGDKYSFRYLYKEIGETTDICPLFPGYLIRYYTRKFWYNKGDIYMAENRLKAFFCYLLSYIYKYSWYIRRANAKREYGLHIE